MKAYLSYARINSRMVRQVVFFVANLYEIVTSESTYLADSFCLFSKEN